MFLPNQDDTPELEQQRFESFFDEEQLNEPLCEGDADQVAEGLINVQHDIRYLFTRSVRQYGPGPENWIKDRLWLAYCKLGEAWDILQQVYDHDGFKER